MEDRAAIDESLRIHKHFPPFFSMLLPELGRPQYLTKCLDGIHKHADMPVEIIVHDDGSTPDKQATIVAQRDKISTLILNHGHNLGLAAAYNRCRKMASSPYLMGFNTDTYLTSPCLANIKAALDLPYVGVVNLIASIKGDGPGIHVTSNGTKVALRAGSGAAQAFGMRADVWDEVGGFNECVQTTSSDGDFVGKAFASGYFHVLVEGTTINEMWANDGTINTNEANIEYVESGIFARDDVNAPPIFKIPIKTHDQLCRARWRRIYHEVNSYRLADPNWASWLNHAFTTKEIASLFRGGVQDIDWEFAKTYGHDKWKDRIITDFNLQ